jgi:hypothetical protein
MRTTTYQLVLANTTLPSDTRTVQVTISHADIARHGSFMKLYLVARAIRQEEWTRFKRRFVTRDVLLHGPNGAKIPLKFTVPDRSVRWLNPPDIALGTMPPTWPCR